MSGITKCDIHGRQIPYLLCEHLHAKISNGIYTPMKYIPLLNLNVCDDCKKAELINDLPEIAIDEALKLTGVEQEVLELKIEEIEQAFPSYAVCSECYRQLHLNNNDVVSIEK